MGSPKDEPGRREDELQHKVILTKGFWIADTPVTQALWQVVMGENPSYFLGEERPVENVSWMDAQAFIAKMNGMKAELKLCLPTEAQWEYACRAGTLTPFFVEIKLIFFKSTMIVFSHIILVNRMNLVNKQLMLMTCYATIGDYIKCMAMYGNGVKIVMTATRQIRLPIRKKAQRMIIAVTIAYCVAVCGSSVAWNAAMLAVITTAPLTVSTSAAAFVLSEVMRSSR